MGFPHRGAKKIIMPKSFSKEHISVFLLSAVVLFAGGTGGEFSPSIYAYYADISKNILLDHDWTTLRSLDDVYLNKPPLVFWLSALCIKFFGANLFAATMPTRIFGVGCVVLTVWIGSSLFNKNVGWWSGIVCLLSILFIESATKFRTEPILLFGSMLAIGSFLLLHTRWKPVFFWGGIGLSVFAKGVIGFFPIALVILYSLVNRPKLLWEWPFFLRWALSALLVTPLFFWYSYQAQRHGVDIVGILKGDTMATAASYATLSWPAKLWQFYLQPLATQYWPWIPFLLIGVGRSCTTIFDRGQPRPQRASFVLLVGWFLMFLLLSPLKRIAYTHYLFPALPAMALLVAREIDFVLQKQRLSNYLPKLAHGLFVFVFIASLLFTCFPKRLFFSDTAGNVESMRQIVSTSLGDNEKIWLMTTSDATTASAFTFDQAWVSFYLERRANFVSPQDLMKTVDNKSKSCLLVKHDDYDDLSRLFSNSILASSKYYHLVSVDKAPAVLN